MGKRLFSMRSVPRSCSHRVYRRDNTTIGPLLLPSKSVPIHHSTLYGTNPDSVVKYTPPSKLETNCRNVTNAEFRVIYETVVA
jgi:hypothetical protein